MDPDWGENVHRINAKMAEAEEPYPVSVDGLTVMIYPKVFSPVAYTDSQWFAEALAGVIRSEEVLDQSENVDFSLLDHGVGTGAIGLLLNKNLADQGYVFMLHGIDSYVGAFRCASDNFSVHRHPESEFSLHRHPEWLLYHGESPAVLPSDVMVDYAFFAHPFNRAEEPVESPLLRTGYDYQYQGLEAYIKDTPDHLKGGGRHLLGTGSDAHIPAIAELARKHGKCLKILRKSGEMPLEPNGTYQTEYYLVEFIH